MKKITAQNIILIFVIYLFIDSLIPFGAPGISKKEQELQIKLHDLAQENILLEKENTQYELKIKAFKDEIITSDSIIDNSTNDQIDSLFTNYFAR